MPLVVDMKEEPRYVEEPLLELSLLPYNLSLEDRPAGKHLLPWLRKLRKIAQETLGVFRRPELLS